MIVVRRAGWFDGWADGEFRRELDRIEADLKVARGRREALAADAMGTYGVISALTADKERVELARRSTEKYRRPPAPPAPKDEPIHPPEGAARTQEVVARKYRFDREYPGRPRSAPEFCHGPPPIRERPALTISEGEDYILIEAKDLGILERVLEDRFGMRETDLPRGTLWGEGRPGTGYRWVLIPRHRLGCRYVRGPQEFPEVERRPVYDATQFEIRLPPFRSKP